MVMTNKREFPVPIHFVHGNIEKWKSVVAREGPVDLAEMVGRIHNSPADGWVFQTYLLIRPQWSNVTISDHFREGCINIVHYDNLKPASGLGNYFIVSIRADRDPTFISDLEVVQNRLCVATPRQYFITPWTQPGLIPRDPARGTTLENIAFIGNIKNLAYRFQQASFRESLAELGVNFIIETKNWWDYSSIDLVLAVRDGKPLFTNSKPASKLIIAWLAGCPALLGPEPAYREIGSDGVDYLEVSEPSQVIELVQALKQDPGLYERLVLSGRERAKAFSLEHIVAEWEDFLNTEAVAAYRAWSGGIQSSAQYRAARYQWRLLRRRLWGYQYYPGYDDSGNPEKESALGAIRRRLFAP